MTHTEPKQIWTRSAAFIAMIHAFTYSVISAVYGNEMSVYPFWFDAFIVFCWAMGGNGRAALIDAVRAWKGSE